MMHRQSNGKTSGIDAVAGALFLVAAVWLGILRPGPATAIPYLLVTCTGCSYIYLLYTVYKALEHKVQLRSHSRWVGIALLSVQLLSGINLLLFGSGFQGFLLALSLLLLLLAVLLLYLRVRYR